MLATVLLLRARLLLEGGEEELRLLGRRAQVV
jgi:hypothetical protein